MVEISQENAATETCGITDVCIVHGWTLSPENPGWYRDLARSIEEAHSLNVDIPNMPTESSPGECNAVLDRTILRPETTLVVGHSLGVMMALNWMAHAAEFSKAQFPGLVSVAGNITNVGFDEITQHFPTTPNKITRPDEVWRFTTPLQHRIGRLTLLYGNYDPWVSFGHGNGLSRTLGHYETPIIVAKEEAHFSGEYITESGRIIPACSSIPLLNVLVNSMIYEANPDSRRTLVARHLFSVLYDHKASGLAYDDRYLDMNVYMPEA